jgi:glycerol kinase
MTDTTNNSHTMLVAKEDLQLADSLLCINNVVLKELNNPRIQKFSD